MAPQEAESPVPPCPAPDSLQGPPQTRGRQVDG